MKHATLPEYKHTDVEQDVHSRSLIVAHTDVWSQKDCISNMQILLEVLASTDMLASLDNEAHRVACLKHFDRHQFGGRLSKASTQALRTKWAATTYVK